MGPLTRSMNQPPPSGEYQSGPGIGGQAGGGAYGQFPLGEQAGYKGSNYAQLQQLFAAAAGILGREPRSYEEAVEVLQDAMRNPNFNMMHEGSGGGMGGGGGSGYAEPPPVPAPPFGAGMLQRLTAPPPGLGMPAAPWPTRGASGAM